MKDRLSKFLTTSILILLCSHVAFAQKRDTLRLFYAINQRELTHEHQIRIDSFCTAHTTQIKAISINAYADYLGSIQYNNALSNGRAANVQAYISQHLPGVTITSAGLGEVASQSTNPVGNPADRRTEVIIELAAPQIAPVPEARKKVEVVQIKPVFRDTVFESKIDSLAMLKPGEKIDLQELLFLGGRHYLTPQSYKYADVLVSMLQKHPKLKIKLIGHICCDYSGRDGYDYDDKKYHLSASRARFLYDYLVKAGIDKNRLRYKGVGSSDPKVFPEETDRDSDLNRRVEIVVTSNDE